MKKRSTEAFLSVYVDLQIRDWHSYFDRIGEVAVKWWKGRVLSDKFNVVMWCMRKGFFGYDKNMKKYCKIQEKCLDSASFAGYNKQACKRSV